MSHFSKNPLKSFTEALFASQREYFPVLNFHPTIDSTLDLKDLQTAEESHKNFELKKFQFQKEIQKFYTELKDCNLCPQHCLEKRQKVVFSPFALPTPKEQFIYFVADSPRSEEENTSGIPFQEDEQNLMKKITKAMNLEEDQYAFGHMVKCLPSDDQNRDVMAQKCYENFLKEIFHFRPQFIVALGAYTFELITQRRERMTLIHGKFFDKTFSLNNEKHNCKILPTFHPEFMLMNPNLKKAVWDDLKKIMEALSTPADQ